MSTSEHLSRCSLLSLSLQKLASAQACFPPRLNFLLVSILHIQHLNIPAVLILFFLTSLASFLFLSSIISDIVCVCVCINYTLLTPCHCPFPLPRHLPLIGPFLSQEIVFPSDCVSHMLYHLPRFHFPFHFCLFPSSRHPLSISHVLCIRRHLKWFYI